MFEHMMSDEMKTSLKRDIENLAEGKKVILDFGDTNLGGVVIHPRYVYQRKGGKIMEYWDMSADVHRQDGSIDHFHSTRDVNGEVVRVAEK
jgi:hypothetical protein